MRQGGQNMRVHATPEKETAKANGYEGCRAGEGDEADASCIAEERAVEP
jgi:hypothetical protein